MIGLKKSLMILATGSIMLQAAEKQIFTATTQIDNPWPTKIMKTCKNELKRNLNSVICLNALGDIFSEIGNENSQLGIQREQVGNDSLAEQSYKNATENYKTASKHYHTLNKLAPADIETILKLAAIEYQIGRVAKTDTEREARYKQALEHSKNACEKAPDYVPARLQFATFLRVANKPEQAIENYKKATETNGFFSEDQGKYYGYAGMGQVLDKLKKYDEAIQTFDKALELFPNDKWLNVLKARSETGKRRSEIFKKYQQKMSLNNSF